MWLILPGGDVPVLEVDVLLSGGDVPLLGGDVPLLEVNVTLSGGDVTVLVEDVACPISKPQEKVMHYNVSQ